MEQSGHWNRTKDHLYLFVYHFGQLSSCNCSIEKQKIHRWKDAFAGLKIKCPVDVNLLYALQEIFWQEGKEKTLRWLAHKV